MRQGLARLICAIVLAWAATAQATTYTWTATAGGAQSWANGLNWSGGSAPSPTTNDTVDFSTVNIAADTSLTLDADRTATTWKFGDTSGTENWIVNSGNKMILVGSPIINVLQNTVTLNNDVDFTAAGFTKDGPGTLILASPNPASGTIKINNSGGRVFLNGSQVTNGTIYVGNGAGSSNNSLIITNGAQVTSAVQNNYCTGLLGLNSRCNSNSVIVAEANGATNSLWNLGGASLALGYSSNCTGNWVMVGNGGVITNANPIVGYPSTGSCGHYLVVTNGGQVFANGSFYIGDGGVGGNWAYVGSPGGAPSVLNGMTKNIQVGGASGNPGSNNRMTVDQGGLVTNSTIYVGYAANSANNGMIITNGGKVSSIPYSYASGWIGNAAGANSNYVIIAGANGATNSLWDAGNSYVEIGVSAGATGNWVKVDNGGVLTNAQPLVGVGGFGNYMVVTNGGQVFANGFAIGDGGSGGNWVYVGSAGASQSVVNGMGGAVYVGGFASNVGSNNLLTVDQGGLVTNVNGVYMGYVGASVGNSMTITSGGQVFSQGNVVVGNGTSAASNTVALVGGGLLDCPGITLGASGMTVGGNTVTNSGGILQFTTASPVITDYNSDAAASKVAIANGTVSYRLSSGVVNLTNNWAGSGNGIGGANVAWSGNNALRLNGAIATNTVAAGYTFANNLGATNYTRLELVNGTNMVKGTGITFDGAHGGSLVLSNTVASFLGGVTMTGGATNILAGPVTVLGNYAVGANTVINWMFTGTSNDMMQVKGGTLTLPSVATVNVVAQPGSVWTTNNPPVLFSADAPISAGSLGGWTIQGDCPKDTAVVIQGNQIILMKVMRGTIISVY